MAQLPLSHADRRKLQDVLDAGHALEKIWARVFSELPSLSDLTRVREREEALQLLIASISLLEQATDENVRRLSFHTRSLNLEMTARHLSTILVPFERLAGRALRDDELLIDEGDGTSRLRVSDAISASISSRSAPMIVVADNIRSAFNVGAILRTAECFAAEHVALTGYTPTPDSEKTARTSLGTEKSVAWSSTENVHDVIANAKRDGYEVIALETVQSAKLLQDFKWPEKAMLLLGNERFGLDRDVLDQADHFVKIPMHGVKNSLNVGIACGIALASWRESVDARSSNAIVYKPIGVFHSHAIHPYEAPRQAVVDESGHESKVVLNGDDQRLREALKDLEGFERVWLIYDFHHNKNWKSLVLPPRGPHVKRGVFATRSPYRPNSVGLSSVELVKIEGRTLTVRGTDLLDGTPILDIKPYVPYADAFSESRAGWLDGLEKKRLEVGFATQAEEKLKWLEERGAKSIRGFMMTQLEYDPLDSDRKRVSQTETAHRLAYRTWRADFTIEDSRVVVTNILSGYSAADLDENAANYQDKYEDKVLHRDFIKNFGA